MRWKEFSKTEWQRRRRRRHVRLGVLISVDEARGEERPYFKWLLRLPVYMQGTAGLRITRACSVRAAALLSSCCCYLHNSKSTLLVTDCKRVEVEPRLERSSSSTLSSTATLETEFHVYVVVCIVPHNIIGLIRSLFTSSSGLEPKWMNHNATMPYHCFSLIFKS